MLFRCRVPLAVAAFALATPAALAGPDDRLAIGDPAPPLQVREFVKGSPVASFEKGKFYVIDLWSTWAAPCRRTIPHLSELQKKYPKVRFIGVSVWEQDQSAVKPFVDQMGNQMAYTVALDRVPDGAAGGQGNIARKWMQAAGQMGIPTSFIINKDGRVAWIGETGSIDDPLSKIVSGNWNMGRERSSTAKQQELTRKLLLLSRKLEKAGRERDREAMVAAIDEAIADEPSIERQVGLRKFMLLLDNPEKAAAYADHLIDDTYFNDPTRLNLLAWTIVDPGKARPEKGTKLADVALKAALRADKIADGKNGAIADTLAAAWFISGDVKKALEAQERAVRYVKGTIFEKDPDIPKRLEEYRKAAGQ